VLLVEANAARATQVSLTRHNVKRMARLTHLTNDQLATALAGSGNIRQALIALGMAPGGANYETIRRRIREAHLNASLSECRGQSRIEASDDEIHNAVARSHSYAQALVALSLAPGGRIQSQFKKRVQSLGLDTSHFWGRGWRRGNSAPVVAPTPLDDFLVEGRFCNSGHLRRRLLASRRKEARCEICGGTRWNDKPIPLELDHINGRREDNRLTNLRLLCPNCHAQTPTYRGRNMGHVDIL